MFRYVATILVAILLSAPFVAGITPFPASFHTHAKGLEALMSVLSEREMEQLHGSLKKLGLLAAAKLHQQEAKVKISKEQARKSQNDLRDSLQ